MQSCQQQLRQLQPAARSTATAGGARPKPEGTTAIDGAGVAGGAASSGKDKAAAAPKAAAAVPEIRYPARLVLSSLMMVHYPRVVFSKNQKVRILS